MADDPKKKEMVYRGPLEKIWMKTDRRFNEQFMKEEIEKDPNILELGDLEIIETEKMLPDGTRIDIEAEGEKNRRYIIELMTGECDADHAQRASLYYELEFLANGRNYDYYVVLVAEDFSANQLRAIRLNMTVPYICIKLTLYKINENTVNFSAVRLFTHPTHMRVELSNKSTSAPQVVWDKDSWNKAHPICFPISEKLVEVFTKVSGLPFTIDYVKESFNLYVKGARQKYIQVRTTKYQGLTFSFAKNDELETFILNNGYIVEEVIEKAWIMKKYPTGRIKLRSLAMITDNEKNFEDCIRAMYEYHCNLMSSSANNGEEEIEEEVEEVETEKEEEIES